MSRHSASPTQFVAAARKERSVLTMSDFATDEDASAAVATPVAGAVFGGLQGAQVEITRLLSEIE